MGGGKLSEVNARTVSRRQNKLVGKFKIAAGDLVSIRGQVMEYTYIPTGIKREMVRSSVDSLSCLLFNLVLEKIVRDAGIQLRGNIYYNLYNCWHMRLMLILLVGRKQT